MLPKRILLAGILAFGIGCQGFHGSGGSCSAPPPGHQQWGGIYPTVLTPWNCDGGVDEEALGRQIAYQIRNGVHGLLVLGTIGEGEYATMAERAQVLRVARRMAHGTLPVVAGIHTCDLQVARDQLLQAKELGADAVLVKYIGNPCASPLQVQEFFQELAAAETLPIFYYHYPSQTHLQLSPSDVAQILLIPGVIGIKESTLDLNETAEHVALTAGQGKVFLSGTALNLTQFLAAGGHGAMCPEGAVLPCPTVKSYQLATSGCTAQAREVQKELFALSPLLRDGHASERSARVVLMCAQDRRIAIPMGGDHPQARLKAALDNLCIGMSASVKCPLPQLSMRDRLKLHLSSRRLRELVDCCAPCPAGPSVKVEPPAHCRPFSAVVRN